MKINQLRLGRLAIAMAAAYPAFAFAVPPAASAYNTDTQNIFVQDQTTEVLKQMNGVLCHIEAMRPDALVGKGNYVALIDGNICSPQKSGGKNSNTGPAYEKGIVNSTTGGGAMLANAWVDDSQGGGTIYAHVSATQAPSATLPYGLFRVDYCSVPNGTACQMKGYVDVTATGGLKFFSYEPWGDWTATSQLQLNGASATAGSGSMSQAITGAGAPPQKAFTFAYDANYFRRSDGANDQCFSRDPLQAKDSVWSYSLYDMTTGAQVTRNSGFPIEYTDATGPQNGYIGYYGLWAPTTPASTTVNQVTYGANGATKTPYTLLQTGGKLTKYTKVATTLGAMDKVTFFFYPQAAVANVFAQGSSYELYWDKAANTFKISGDMTDLGVIPRATPTVVTVANMQTASPYGGLFGWSQALGGDFTISNTDFDNLANGLSNTTVIAHTQDIVYPADFAALGGLKCIGNCPTAADITAAMALNSVASPFGATADQGWVVGVAAVDLTSYTLNAATGNLVDPAAAPVVNSTATSGKWQYGIPSGRLIAAADMQALDAAKATAELAYGGSSPAGFYTQSDVDLINTYYIWETGANDWNKIGVLKDAAGVTVKFDAPLQVSFAVPNTAAYGSFAGSTIQLWYGGVGDLWGIPFMCVDLATNAACTNATTNAHITPEFSIPFDSATGIVTVANTVGAVTAGTQYLVKGLDVERRLAKVALATCTAAGLNLPDAATIALPDATGFQDPGPAGGANYIGAVPALDPMPAPRVIHGDVKY